MCPICRKLVYKERQKLCDSLPEYAPSLGFPCESVSASDFFDYVIPYGLDPANDQYAKFRESLTSHLRICPNCLAKMQELHRTVYGISERPESDVVTVYHIDESAKAQAIGETEELYAGFPIRVDVKQREEVKAEQPVPAIDFAATMKQKVSVKKLKPLLKTGVVAAAVILIAIVLFQSIPAKAVTLERIYKAIEKIRNVHIISFTPPNKEPAQELWLSRALNIYMTKTAKQSVLWDIANRTRKTKQLDIGITETIGLNDDIITNIKRKMSSTLDLMPFSDISGVPEDADWSRVADKDLETTTEGIEVYDLTWTERAYDGSIVSKKWRFFVNAKADLPRKIEIYQSLPTDTEYILKSLMVIEYLSDNEMQEVIKKASF
jgi:hypothetical protein